jgi:hypothetical protein
VPQSVRDFSRNTAMCAPSASCAHLRSPGWAPLRRRHPRPNGEHSRRLSGPSGRGKRGRLTAPDDRPMRPVDQTVPGVCGLGATFRTSPTPEPPNKAACTKSDLIPPAVSSSTRLARWLRRISFKQCQQSAPELRKWVILTPTWVRARTRTSSETSTGPKCRFLVGRHGTAFRLAHPVVLPVAYQVVGLVGLR